MAPVTWHAWEDAPSACKTREIVKTPQSPLHREAVGSVLSTWVQGNLGGMRVLVLEQPLFAPTPPPPTSVGPHHTTATTQRHLTPLESANRGFTRGHAVEGVDVLAACKRLLRLQRSRNQRMYWCRHPLSRERVMHTGVCSRMHASRVPAPAREHQSTRTQRHRERLRRGKREAGGGRREGRHAGGQAARARRSSHESPTAFRTLSGRPKEGQMSSIHERRVRSEAFMYRVRRRQGRHGD